MSAIGVTCGRTIGMARNIYSTALAIGGFLAAAAALFSFNLGSAEGGLLSIEAVWAVSVSPILPVLAAFLAMDVWSDERQTGRIDTLLTVPVRERDFVLGKFFGVWTLVLTVTLFFLVLSVGLLWFFAPQSLAEARLSGFGLAFLSLAMQSALWSAVSVAFSALFCHAAAAACLAIVLTAVAPRGIWAALTTWSGQHRPLLGEMPLDAHVIDFSSGLISTGIIASYVILTLVMLFLASKAVLSLRFVGKGAAPYKASTLLAVVLAFVAAGLAIVLARRMTVEVDIPVTGNSLVFSARTKAVMADAGGKVSVTCFLSRSDVRYRSVAQFLRALCRTAESGGGVRLDVRFVDPHWDLGAAERFVRQGVTEDSLVFERGRRMIVLPLRDGYGERSCVSAIRNLMTPPQRRHIYWTVGHKEGRFDDYGKFGASDIAREIAREGYRNVEIDLASGRPVPGDCALIVIAGAKVDFSRAELERLDAYLHDGGRLLVLLDSVQTEGLTSLLATWGIRSMARTIPSAQTTDGMDVIVTEFSEHAISASLRGSRIVLEHPVSFVPSATAGAGSGADRVDFLPVASVGEAVLVAAGERGSKIGEDLALRPTRVVAVGDGSFVLNGALSIRANANCDFFLNCISYLAGTETSGASGVEANLLIVGMDRDRRLRHLFISAGVVPAAILLLMALAIYARRRRT